MIEIIINEASYINYEALTRTLLKQVSKKQRLVDLLKTRGITVESARDAAKILRFGPETIQISEIEQVTGNPPWYKGIHLIYQPHDIPEQLYPNWSPSMAIPDEVKNFDESCFMELSGFLKRLR